MKRLTEYTKNKYEFRLVQRVADYAIFLGLKEKSPARNYEVIKIQSHQGREIHGKSFPPAEYPPSDSQWGTQGWTYPTFRQAQEKLHSLTTTHS